MGQSMQGGYKCLGAEGSCVFFGSGNYQGVIEESRLDLSVGVRDILVNLRVLSISKILDIEGKVVLFCSNLLASLFSFQLLSLTDIISK